MSVNVSGGDSLSWTASIGTQTFNDDVKVILQGYEKIDDKVVESGEVQQKAFEKVRDGLKALGQDTTQLEKLYNGFVVSKNAVVDLQTELAKLKAPDYLTGKTPEQIKITNQYITQQEKLLKDLQIQMHDYAQELINTSNIKVDTAPITVTPITETPKGKVSDIISAQVLEELKQQFTEIDPITQNYIKTIIELQLKVQEFANTQKQLDDAFNAGSISQEEYTQGSQFLIAGIQSAEEEVKKLTQAQQDYQDSLKVSTGSIAEKKQQLDELKQTFVNLTEAERQSESGIKLGEEITALEIAIKNLDPTKIKEVVEPFADGSVAKMKQDLKDLTVEFERLSEAERTSDTGVSLGNKIKDLEINIKSLDPTKVEVVKDKVVTMRTELTRLQELMARNPDSPLFGKWKKEAGELKESIEGVKKGIEQATNSTAGLEAFTSGLRGIFGAFESGVGIIGLFTDDTEKYEEVTKDAAAALALMNGIQEVSNVLSKSSALNVYLLGLAHKANTAATVAETTSLSLANVAAARAATQSVIQGGALTIQTEATVAATTATEGLTAALLANPAGLVIAAIAALAAAYLIFSEKGEKAVTAQEALNTTLGDYKKGVTSAIEKTTEVKVAFDQAREGVISKDEALKIYNETLGDSLGKTESLTEAEKLYADGADTYIKIQGLKQQANALFAKSGEELANSLTAQNSDQTGLLSKIKAGFFQYFGDFADARKTLFAAQDSGVQEATAKSKENSATFLKTGEELLKQAQELGEKIKPKTIRGIDAIDKDIADLKKAQSYYAETSEQYKKYQVQIKNLETERASIAGKSKATISEENKAQREYNKLVDEQRSLLEKITSLKHDATQSGLTEEASALDKINEKYDLLKNKVEDFNTRAPKLAISTDPIEEARQTELTNQAYKNDAANFKKVVDQKQDYFTAFEDFKLQYGKEKADALFKEQTGGASSYLDYLKQQKAAIEGSDIIGPKPQLNNGQILKLQDLNKAIAAEEEKQRTDNFRKQIEDYVKLLEAAKTFNEQKADINKKYDDLEKTLAADNTIDATVRAEKKKILENARKEELTAAANDVTRQSELYKTLNADLINYTKKNLRERLELLKKYLEDDKALKKKEGENAGLTPDQLKALKDAIKTATDGIKSMATFAGLSVDEINKIAAGAKAIGGDISKLGDAIKPFNEGLGEAISQMGEMISIGGDVAKAVASFASGDIVGGIGSVVSVITGIFSIGARRRAQREKDRQEEEARQLNIVQGEVLVNDEYRKRLLLQSQINKLKIEGIRSEFAALQANRQSVTEDYNTILSLIQKQSAVNLFSEDEINMAKWEAFFEGNSAKWDVIKAAMDLSTKSFDELQQLFLKGQLDAKATELFKTLERLKAEGVDIDKQLEENKKKAQEIFTGTTSDSILDAIVQGFADGKRATADFADDFTKLMQKAVLNSLKYQALEKPLQKFYEDFANAAASDDVLTADEIAQLEAYYNATITAASAQFDQLKNITNLDFTGNTSNNSGNTLSGAIKGITQTQADLLAGQFGGLRITAFDQLAELKNANNILREIANNTQLLSDITFVLQYMKNTGIKLI